MLRIPDLSSDSERQFCNADSFAAAFDATWRLQSSPQAGNALSRQETLERVLAQLSQHPFAQMDAARAREVGEFRLRLLGL